MPPNDAEIGFIFISCGPFARTYRAEIAVESLVKRGGWRGNIYILTDSLECFDLEKIRTIAGSSLIFLVSINKFSQGLEPFVGLSGFLPYRSHKKIERFWYPSHCKA